MRGGVQKTWVRVRVRVTAKAQPPDKGGNIVSLENCQIQFV